MVNVLARNWSYAVFRGVAALVFGVLTWFMPSAALARLILVFGVYALVDGLTTLVWALRDRGRERVWVPVVLGGSLGVAIGIVTLVAPGSTELVALYLIATWAILTGIALVAAAIRLRKEITGEWMLALAGVLSVAFGTLLMLLPGTGALAVTAWIAAYAVVFGITLMAFGLRLRRWGARGAQQAPAPTTSP